MLERIFKRPQKQDPGSEPRIIFGRYSDNNKPLKKIDQWNEAEGLFKEKKFKESIALFFEYLKDDEEENVLWEEDERGGKFQLYQGSKIIRGYYTSEILEAEVALAAMPQPSVPVMRRLLELNFALYYSRYAIANGKLCMLFDSDVQTANPGKLYYGLKELATKADKLDDLLVHDFTSLQPTDIEHIEPIPDGEKEIKYTYFRKWIEEALNLIHRVDADKFSGGIAYLLLSLAFRIDYLIVPEGKLLSELEKVVEIYFRKDNRLVTEKNEEMMDVFTKMLQKTKAEFFPYLFRSRYTFSINNPQNYKTIADAIYNANQNVSWYRENKYFEIASQISEYGLSYCQYSYSLPRPVTELFKLFMMVNYADYFAALGFKDLYYYTEKGMFNKEAVLASVESIQQQWKEKYPGLNFKTDALNFENKVTFNHSFTSEIERLNLNTD